MAYKPGDKLEVRLEAETLSGTFVPSPEGRDDILVLKLASGYNLILKKEKIKSISLIEKLKQSRKKQVPVVQDLSLPKVTLLHTGGTIAARVDYKLGAVLAGYITADELLSIYPEASKMANIKTKMVCNISSEDMRFGHYNLIIDAITEEVKNGARAIIIPHGTDSMTYTSAALAFALEGLQIPVILVGSQRSSDRGSSDAYLNLMSAVYFAVNEDFKGVAICMHHSPSDDKMAILPPLKVRKMHTSRRDAFRPIDATPYALVDYVSKEIERISGYPERTGKQLVARKFDDGLKIAIINAHPNMTSREITPYKGFDGLIIEGTGLGHFPNAKTDGVTAENERVFREVKKIIEAGVLVVIAPQTIYGRIHLAVYTPGRRIRNIGVLGHLSDMTPETAFIKMAFLLSNYTKEEARQLMDKNLRGEISSRLEVEEFLV